jgi:PAS domain S-box-containing protein
MESSKKPSYKELENEIIKLKKANIYGATFKSNQGIATETLFSKEVLARQKNLNDIFNNIQEPIWLINIEKKGLKTKLSYSSINTACSLLLGLTAQEAEGKLLEDIIPKEMLAPVLQGYLKAIESEEVYKYQQVLDLPGGEKCFETTLAPIFDNKKVMIKLLGITYDKTEAYNISKKLILQNKDKKRAEKSEKELTKTQEITQVGSWSLDLATNEVKWTKELFKMYGLDPSLPAPTYPELQTHFTSESWETLNSEITKTSETGIPYEIELETVKTDGSNGWMWARGEVVTDKSNKIIGLWGAAQDISDRKNIELELRLAKEENTKLLESKLIKKDASLNSTILELQDYQNAINISSIISMTDINGAILSVNKYFTDISGYSEKELENKNQSIVSSGIHSIAFWKEMWEKIGKGDAWSGQIKNKRKDGSFYWVHTAIYPFIVNGKPFKYLSIMHDITKLIEGEEIKLALETTEISLNEKMTLLKEVHHRVKNNLQVITGLIGLQKNTLKVEGLDGFFNDLSLRIQAITSVHELLYQSDDLGRINPKEYIQNLINGILNSYSFVDVDVDVDVDVEGINLSTSIPLGLIINEIVTNTCKYAISDERENKIFVKLYHEDVKLVMIVGDNGGGFFEKHQSTKTLGLKLIDQLSKQLKGSIVKDDNYKGTRYILNFKEIN